MPQNEEIIMTIEGVSFTERELKLVGLCKTYNQDAFGAPNHNLLVVVAKLAQIAEKKAQFTSNWWSST